MIPSQLFTLPFPIAMRSISAVANLLAHNYKSQICYCGQISLQSASVITAVFLTIWHLLGYHLFCWRWYLHSKIILTILYPIEKTIEDAGCSTWYSHMNVQFPVQLFCSISLLILVLFTLKQKMKSFDLKSWVTGGTKIRPGIPSNWRIFESNWLDNESQFLNEWTLKFLGQNGSIFSFSVLCSLGNWLNKIFKFELKTKMHWIICLYFI